MIDRAVILAAGRGTRLGALTDAVPKPLIEVGGVSMIERVLTGLSDAGVHRVLVVTGYRADQLEDAIWGMAGLSIEFVRQTEQLGTGHAVGLARDFAGTQPFFFGWADIVVEPQNYQAVVGVDPCDAVLAVNRVDDPTSGAAVYVDVDGRVSEIIEKPPAGTSSTPWNNAGFGVLGSTIWPHIEALSPSERGELELTDAIRGLLAAGGDVRAVEVSGPWFDIGTPETLTAANRHFDSSTTPSRCR